MLAAFAGSRVLPLSYGLIFLGSIGLMMSFSLLTSLVQLAAPNEMRGRVVSIYMMAFRGGMPLGSLAAGILRGPHVRAGHADGHGTAAIVRGRGVSRPGEDGEAVLTRARGSGRACRAEAGRRAVWRRRGLRERTQRKGHTMFRCTPRITRAGRAGSSC